MSALMRNTVRRGAAALAFLVMGAVSLHAQVPSASAAALGMGDNYTALARGVDALAWNPAGLGMPDNPGFSFTFLPLRAQASVAPIGPADLAEFDGQRIPISAREDWLQRIVDAGGEGGSFAVDATEIAISISHLALSLSTSVRGQINMAPAFAELFFFGNAGRTGDPANYTFEGTSFDVAATSTAALSYGMPLKVSLGPLPDQNFSVGATVKYTVGHYFVTGADDGGTLTSNPLAVNLSFPFAVADTSFEGFPDQGSGLGLDVGASWSASIFSAGVMIQNLVSTFEWNIDDMFYYRGSVTFNADTSYTEFEDALPFSDAPETLKSRVEELFQFDPVLRAGAAVRVLPFLEVSGDIRHQIGESLQVGARNHVGVGAELTILPFLPVRAGFSAISGGYLATGGLGLNLGPIDLDAAASFRQDELGSGAGFAAGLRIGM